MLWTEYASLKNTLNLMVYCSVAFKSELDSHLKHSHSQTRDTK